MYKPKNKCNRNKIIEIVAAIISFALLIIFILLTTSDMAVTQSLYAAQIFTFIFGSLGLITSLGSLFKKS